MSADVYCHQACTDRILDAALEVFSKEGYNASIDAVAARAKVARQTIYNHFSSKQMLFEAALARATAELFATLQAEEGDLRDRLIQFGLKFRARVLSPEAINLHRVLVSESPRFPELADSFFNNCVMRTCRQISAMLERAMNDGQLRHDDPAEASQFLVELLVGFDRLKTLFVGPAPLSAAAEKARVTRIIDRFLQAYAVAPTRRSDAATG